MEEDRDKAEERRGETSEREKSARAWKSDGELKETGDGHARKHLQRIGLTRVFNPARGFLAGGIKRGQVKRDAKKDCVSTHARACNLTHVQQNCRRKGFYSAQSKEREGDGNAVFGEISSL